MAELDAIVKYLGGGNKTYANPLEPDVYTAKQDQATELRRSLLEPSGFTMDNALEMGVAGGLPLLIGALLGGSQGAAAGAGAGAQASSLLAQLQAGEREKAKERNLFELLEINKQLEAADAAKAEEYKRKTDFDWDMKRERVKSQLNPSEAAVEWGYSLDKAGGDPVAARAIYVALNQRKAAASGTRITNVYNPEKQGLPDKQIEAIQGPAAIASQAQDLMTTIVNQFPELKNESYYNDKGDIDFEKAYDILKARGVSIVGGAETNLGELETLFQGFVSSYQKMLSGLSSTDKEFERLLKQVEGEGWVPTTIPTRMKLLQHIQRRMEKEAVSKARTYELLATPGDPTDKIGQLMREIAPGPLGTPTMSPPAAPSGIAPPKYSAGQQLPNGKKVKSVIPQPGGGYKYEVE